MTGVEPLDEVLDELSRDIRRVSSRLRSLPPARFDQHRDAVRSVLQQLAEIGAELQGEPVRTVPHLADHGLGDQVDVLGSDVLAAARDRSGEDGVDQLVQEAAAALRELRRSL